MPCFCGFRMEGVRVRPPGRPPPPHPGPRPVAVTPGGARTRKGDLVSASVRVTPLRLTAAAAVAALAVGAVALPAAAADRPGPHWDRAQVVIGDVQYGPSRFERSNHSLNREWVEITNNGRRDVNL